MRGVRGKRGHSMRGVISVASVCLSVACLLVAGTLAHKEAPANKQSVPSKQNVTTTTTTTTSTTTDAFSTALPPSTSTSGSREASSTLALGLASSSTTVYNPPAGKEPSNRVRNSTGGEQLEQQATNQAVIFAEPLAKSNKQQEHQQSHHRQSGSAGGPSNRWTHFGARLRPLVAAPVDHQTAAANSKSLLANYANGNGNANANGRLGLAANRKLESNQLDEEADDEQDSEALLYKMMQQQSFLLSPSWQGQEQSRRRLAANQPGSYANNNNNNNNNNRQMEEPDNGSPISLEGNEPSSRKVIKLLKSYSHIHQVDDSDDQIRGTYQRLAARRPHHHHHHQQQQQQQQHNGSPNNRFPSSQQAGRQHIFVSSQPMTRAFSQNQANSRPDEGQDNYAPSPSGDEQDSPGEGDQAGSGPEEDDFECPNNGIFADEPSGCQAYHVCQSGAQVQQRFQCPLGTLFNNIILTCDFAHNVQCGGKNKLASKQTPDGLQDANLESMQGPQRPQQQQQTSRQPNRLQSAAGNNQQQQRTWSPQGQQVGPRPLSIGQQTSQYNRHQAAHMGSSSRAQALNSYPRPTPAAGTSDNGDDQDDEQPLVPATLPPRLMPVLPYNQPPRPQPNQQQQQQQQYRQQPGVNYQQSSTPAYQPFTGSYDGASAVTPVFASRDESTTPIATSVAPNQPQDMQLNLVINHVATMPAKPHTTSLNKPVSQKKVIIQQQQHSSGSSVNQNDKNLRHTADSKPKQTVVRQKVSGNQQQPKRTSNLIGLSQQRPINPEQLLPAAVKPAVIDLTGDNRKASGVSSEALNEGLLLVVRHDSGSNPIKVAGPQQTNQQAYFGQSKKRVGGAQTAPNRKQSGGQAFAVDPAVVRPNSAVDAQLFPNVQRVIAAAHSQPQVSHQAGEVSSNQQPVSSQSRQTSNYGTNVAQPKVSPPLPPMAPPKPIIEQTNVENNYVSRSPADQIDPFPATELSSGTTTHANLIQPSNPPKSQQRRIKRTRRLKASQLPKNQLHHAHSISPSQPMQPSTIESRTSVIVHSSSQQQVAGSGPSHAQH